MEGELVPVARVHVPIRTTGTAVVVIDAHLVTARAEPANDEIGIGVRAEHLGGRGVELSDHPDERDLRVDFDLRLVSGAHHLSPPVFECFVGFDGLDSTSSGISRSTSSRRR